MNESAAQYYQSAAVRARLREFLGRDSLGEATSRYLVQGETTALHLYEHHPVEALDSLLDEGAEIARSLWDTKSLLVDLDVEYVNFDRPAEVFLNPERAFALQAPVQKAIENLLTSYGIVPLHLLSGRGHHFIWRIAQDSPAFQRLTKLGHASASLLQATSEQPAPDGAVAAPDLARAFSGLGLVMEFLAHRVKGIAARASEIPVELTAMEVGPSDRGREMISIDISEYGDPLPVRMLRVPFSVYLKPWQQRGMIAADVLDQLEPLFVIPLGVLDVPEALAIMRSPAQVTQLAETASAEIPDASGAMEQLIADYEASALRKFHADFYAQELRRGSAGPRPTIACRSTSGRPVAGSSWNSLTICYCGHSASSRSCASCSRSAGMRATSPASSVRNTNAISVGRNSPAATQPRAPIFMCAFLPGFS